MALERWLSVGLWLLAIVLAGLIALFPGFLLLFGLAALLCFGIGGWVWRRTRGLRPRALKADERLTTVRELAQQGHGRLEADHELRHNSPNADARSQALRLWLDRWEPKVEAALVGDASTLNAFRRLVDTSGMHYAEVPLHQLRVRLERLQPYVGGSFTAEAVIGPTVVPLTNHQVEPAPAPEKRPAEPDDPPAGWNGQFWQGKHIIMCPWDDYRTIDPHAFSEHQDTHRNPPTDALAQEVLTMPRPWAIVPIHFLGDGSSYFPGVPADPDHTLYATRPKADELVASGLYGHGPAASQEHGFSGAIGRTIVCKCGFEAATTPEFESHLAGTMQA